MILKGDLITKEQAQNAFFSSYEGKYTIMDNLDEKGDPVIHARNEIYNSEYVYVTVVLRGTLHMIVSGTRIELKANDSLTVTPCMSVTIEESRCIYFTFLTSSYLMLDMYKRTNVINKMHYHAFKFRHIRLDAEKIAVLLECYKRIKREHQQPDYPMKEVVLRAYQSAYLAKFFSLLEGTERINYVTNSRQYAFFNEFLSLLNQQHKAERAVQYYAKQLNITPKYLSSIVHKFTGMTASQAIDQYVVFAIKQTLYSNEYNIKKVSEEYNFQSQSFFGRYFKRITGLSPNAYLKKNNIKSINFVQKKKEN
jgi:YesN/AraC family two-component response regulator